MKKIYDFGIFLESKNEKESSGDVKNEVKKIIFEMFAFGKNIEFSGDHKGEPKFVEFEISDSDYKLNYGKDDLFIEYSANVLKKRQFRVSLKFDSKSEGNKVKFKINLTPTSEIKIEKNIMGWSFDEKPKKVISFLGEEKVKFKWNQDTNILSISKNNFDKMTNSNHLKTLISDEGGVKIIVK